MYKEFSLEDCNWTVTCLGFPGTANQKETFYWRNSWLYNNGFYREDICLQTLFLLFKCSWRETKEFFVSPANSSLAGILITIGDVTDIFAILPRGTYFVFDHFFFFCLELYVYFYQKESVSWYGEETFCVTSQISLLLFLLTLFSI